MLGVGIIIPCTQAAVSQPFSEILGIASGLFFFIQMLFGGLCALLLQFLAGIPVINMTYLILCSSILLCFSFHYLIWRKIESQ